MNVAHHHWHVGDAADNVPEHGAGRPGGRDADATAKRNANCVVDAAIRRVGNARGGPRRLMGEKFSSQTKRGQTGLSSGRHWIKLIFQEGRLSTYVRRLGLAVSADLKHAKRIKKEASEHHIGRKTKLFWARRGTCSPLLPSP